MGYQLDPAKPLGSAAARLAGDLLREGLAPSKKPLTERIHHARTTCKKTRALLRLLRARHAGFFRRENRRLRDAADLLAGLRDAEALLSAAQTLSPAGREEQAVVRALQRQLAAYRRAALANRETAEAQLAAFRRDLQASRRAVARWRPHDCDFEAMAGEIEATYRKARRLAKCLRPDASGTAYHEWRKAVKAFGYHCRLLRGAWPKLAKPFAKEAERLGDLLGDEHDLTILRDFIAEGAMAQPATVDPRPVQLVTRERLACRRRAHEVSERLFAEKPRAYVKRLARWWRHAARTRDKSKPAV
jgi:CHAD domain-containing protein